MKIGSRVICAYAGQTDKLHTQEEYVVINTHDYEGNLSHVTVRDLQGNVIAGDYHTSRFMLKDEMIKQVLENAKNGSN